jgi:hypothetical protein
MEIANFAIQPYQSKFTFWKAKTSKNLPDFYKFTNLVQFGKIEN